MFDTTLTLQCYHVYSAFLLCLKRKSSESSSWPSMGTIIYRMDLRTIGPFGPCTWGWGWPGVASRVPTATASTSFCTWCSGNESSIWRCHGVSMISWVLLLNCHPAHPWFCLAWNHPPEAVGGEVITSPPPTCRCHIGLSSPLLLVLVSRDGCNVLHWALLLLRLVLLIQQYFV